MAALLVALRPMVPFDWDAVRQIYELGIATGLATLETHAPSWAEWDRVHLPDHRLVALDERDAPIGWAALAYAHRTVWPGVAESSVYVHPARRGAGIGAALLGRLIDDSERAGFWTLEARILEGNLASLALHTRLGFRVVGVRERIGTLHGCWHNVLLLERRSAFVGES